jgi:CRP/FNR family transcriptional regulator
MQCNASGIAARMMEVMDVPTAGQCASCAARERCWPAGLRAGEFAAMEQAVAMRVSVPRGARVVRSGAPFKNIYAVRTGLFKTCRATPDGEEQITGFHMSGEFLGLDGVAYETHICDAVAQVDSEVCALSFPCLEAFARADPRMQRHLHHILGRELSRVNWRLRYVGSLRADERVAGVLVDLADRAQARGLSAQDLSLNMSREELGNYLGLRLETVSRVFARMVAKGIVEVRLRKVRILDRGALLSLALR